MGQCSQRHIGVKKVIMRNWINVLDITTTCQYTTEKIVKEIQRGLSYHGNMSPNGDTEIRCCPSPIDMDMARYVVMENEVITNGVEKKAVDVHNVRQDGA